MTRVRIAVLLVLILDGLSLPAHGTRCKGPPIRRVIDAAVKQAGLCPGQTRSWSRRLGWAALLPRLSARLARARSGTEAWDLGPRQTGQDLRSYLALRWEVRATWDLSRLVYDRQTTVVSRRASQIGQERRRLVGRVIQLYYERCGLIHLMRAIGEPQRDARRLRLREVTALLDALTGGMFAKEHLDD